MHFVSMGGTPDTDPPAPDPMTFASAPAATGSSSITMTATAATDASGVEYYFTETSGNPGGSDSGWQDSPDYTDTGLTPETQYSYTVTARDKSSNQNTTAPSAAASSTTDTATNATDYASSEVPVAGSVMGSIAATQASDNNYQAVTEAESGGKPANRHSYLEHKWLFNVTGGTTVTFHVEAYHSSNSEGDDFTFAYSTTGPDGAYTNMVAVTKTGDDDTTQAFVLPPGVSGQVHVRVVDTDRGQGNRNLDTIYIDEMYFASEVGVAGLIAPSDSDLWALDYPGVDLNDAHADLDGDGLNDGDEYAWGLDPTASSSANPIQVALSQSTGTLVYTRRNPILSNYSFRYECSTTLTPDRWTSFTPVSETVQGGEPVETVTITLSHELLTSPSLFVRVVATRN